MIELKPLVLINQFFLQQAMLKRHLEIEQKPFLICHDL